MNPFRKIADAIRARFQRGWLGGGYMSGAPVLSGTFVSPETALGIAAVYSSINVISRDIAVLPRAVYRKNPDGGKEIETAGQLGDLNEVIAVQPDDNVNGLRWMQDKMGHVLGRGNGYSEIIRKKGFPTSLKLLHPAKTTLKITDSGRLYYELDNKRKIDPDNVLHFAGLGFNGIIGYPVLTLMRQTLGIAMGTEQFAASMYGNGAFISGWIKKQGALSVQARENLRRSFNQVHQGSAAAHQVAILEEGMEFQPNQITPEDAQMILTREFSVKDIARIFGIPPHKIGDYSESHLANVEEANLDYVQTTLMGWIYMVEMAMNTSLLTREQRKTHVICIDVSSMLRGNIQARMLRAQTLRNVGAWSADDILIAEGLNPTPAGSGGDKRVIQSQYIPLDQLGKQPAPAKPPGSPAIEEKTAFPGLEIRLNGHENGVN